MRRSAPALLTFVALVLAQRSARADSLAVVSPRGPGHVAIAWNGPPPPSGELVLQTHGTDHDTVHARVLARPDGIARADVPGLEPGAQYDYDAGDGHAGRFLAPPAADGRVRFAVYGDTRSGNDAHRRLVQRMASLSPDLFVTTGDLVADGASTEAWSRFFVLEHDAITRGAFASARGNHDGDEWFGRLAALRSDEDGAGVTYGSFDDGAAHFLVLDTELSVAPGGPQYEFARRDLEAHQGRGALFVVMHKPLFSTGRHGGTPAIHDALAPLFQRTGVDVVFQGHDHHYERTRPINGVTYVVTGGGGAILFGAAGGPWTAVKESVHHFVLVDASRTRVQLTAQRLDGSVLDAFELDPRANDHPPPTLSAAPIPPPGGGGCAMIFLGRERHVSRAGSCVPLAGLALFRAARRRRRRRTD